MGDHSLLLPVLKRVITDDEFAFQHTKPKAVDSLRRVFEMYDDTVHLSNNQRVGSTTFGDEVLYSCWNVKGHNITLFPLVEFLSLPERGLNYLQHLVLVFFGHHAAV